MPMGDYAESPDEVPELLPPPTPVVVLELSYDEAEWLTAVMGLVMQLARHWDDRTSNDVAGRVSVRLGLARLTADVDQANR